MVKFVNTYLQAQIKGRRKKRIFYGQADRKGWVEGGGGLTDRQTLKDRTTQLLIKYKSGALVTQKWGI